MRNIYGITLEELETYFIEHNIKKFKATQVFEWLYKKRVSSFDEMTNVGKDIISQLKQDFNIMKLKIVTKREDIDVVKYLFELSDHN